MKSRNRKHPGDSSLWPQKIPIEVTFPTFDFGSLELTTPQQNCLDSKFSQHFPLVMLVETHPPLTKRRGTRISVSLHPDKSAGFFADVFWPKKKNRWCQHDGPNHGGQVGKMSNTRWFKVTFSSPSWRSLNLWKGHLDTPKRSQRIARQMHFANDLQKIW